MTVLVVGAGGDLGGRIAREMRTRGLRVRSGVRQPAAADGGLAALGDVVRADLADPGSLHAACEGAAVVVSAVQGGRDVIVDGQRRLLEAARAAGVSRFVPSDYSMDLFALRPGENWGADDRRDFDRHLMGSGQGYTILFNGEFMEAVASPVMEMVDPQAGTLSFWGDGRTPVDLTAMDDAAAFLAEIVCDPATMNQVVRVAGERLTMSGIADAYREATGRGLTLVSRGSIEQGYAELDRLKAEGADPARVLPLMYQLPLVSGRAGLGDLDNARYPQICPARLVDVLRARRNN